MLRTLISTAIIASSLSAPLQADELKFASFVSPLHTISASVVDKLSGDLSAATDGALTVRNYAGGELGKGPVEQYVRVVQGAADIAWGLQGYTSSQFPKTMIIELPGAVTEGGNGYDMLWSAYEEHLSSEYPATKPLALWVSEPNIFIMKEREIRSPADIKGLKLRVAGAVAADVITALGATPVQMPITQVYNALDTGLIDGVITGASAVADFKLHEVAKSYSLGAPLGRIAFFAVMGQAKYDSLPADQQAAIDAASGIPLSKSAEDAWNAKADQSISDLKADAKNTVIDLSTAELAGFADITLPLASGVVDAINGGAAVLAAMQSQ